MSYHIYYDKQFVSLPEAGKVIPMICGGDNNCYEATGGGSRRTRDFYVATYYLPKGEFAATPDEIVAAVQARVDDEMAKCDTDEYRKKEGTTREMVAANYGWYVALSMGGGGCGGVSVKKFLGFFKSGIENARTIEEFAAAGVRLAFTCYDHSYYHGTTYSVPKPRKAEINTEADFWKEKAKWEAWAAECVITLKDKGSEAKTVKPHLYLNFDEHDDKRLSRIFLAMRKANNPDRPKKEKVKVEVGQYYVLANPNGYLVKYTSRGFRYGYDATGYSNKRFETEKAAEAYRLNLVKKGRHMAGEWKVMRVDGKATFLREAA
jgi:hypothetical protein